MYLIGGSNILFQDLYHMFHLFIRCLAVDFLAVRFYQCWKIPGLHTLSSSKSSGVWTLQKLARYLKRRYGLTFHIPFVNWFFSSSWISTFGLIFLLLWLSSTGLLYLYYLRLWPDVVGSLPHIRRWIFMCYISGDWDFEYFSSSGQILQARLSHHRISSWSEGWLSMWWKTFAASWWSLLLQVCNP